jgi:hypothetical protein
MKRTIGILMIFSIFVAMFVFTVYEKGIVEASIGWGIIALFTCFASVAGYLIESGDK